MPTFDARRYDIRLVIGNENTDRETYIRIENITFEHHTDHQQLFVDGDFVIRDMPTEREFNIEIWYNDNNIITIYNCFITNFTQDNYGLDVHCQFNGQRIEGDDVVIPSGHYPNGVDVTVDPDDPTLWHISIQYPIENVRVNLNRNIYPTGNLSIDDIIEGHYDGYHPSWCGSFVNHVMGGINNSLPRSYPEINLWEII